MREADLYRMLDGTADAGFVIGPGGFIRYWNKAAEQLFGFSSATVAGKLCQVVMQGTDTAGSPVCGPDCTITGHGPHPRLVPSFDMQIRTSSGEAHWVNVTIIFTETYRGERLAIHLARDVDARKRMENVTRSFLAQIAGLSGEKIEDLMHPAPPPHGQLTAREKQIAGLLALGKSTAAIAEELEISRATVRNHVRNIMGRLSAHSRTEAVLRAIREKLI